MGLRIVRLAKDWEGIPDNDWYGVYQGANLLFSYRGQDALSIVVEWRADRGGEK